MLRKKAIITALRNPDLMHQLFQNGPIGVLMVGTDAKIEMMNPRAAHLLGIQNVRKFQGKHITSLPGHRQSGLKKWIEGGLRGDAFETRADILQIGREPRFHRYKGVPIRNQNDEVIMLLVTVEDIATMRKIERALIEANDKYHTVFESSPEAVILIDHKANIVDLNGRIREWLEYTPAEIVGLNLRTIPFLSAQEKFKVINKFAQRIAGRTVQPYDVEFISKSGKRRIGRIKGRSVQKHGGHNYAVITIQNVTEELKFRQAKEDFVAIASHQLRTPLTTVKWYSQLLQKNVGEQLKGEDRTYLRQIEEATKQMLQLISDLLGASVIDKKGDVQVTMSKQSLDEIMRAIVHDVHVLAKEHDIHVQLDTDDNSFSIQADKEKLRQALLNIVDNAIRYSKKGGNVVVTLSHDNGDVICAIKDSGIGIPPEDHDKVFSRFFRSENAKKKRANGTGMGLYISKSIVEAHGGSITFSSKPDIGTTFVVTLPVAGTIMNTRL